MLKSLTRRFEPKYINSNKSFLFLIPAREFCVRGGASSETGKRSSEATAGTILEHGKIGGVFRITKNPSFLDERLDFFNKIYQRQQQELQQAPKRDIEITLKDGKIIKGRLFETTPLEIAFRISKKLAASVYGAKIVYSKKEQFPLVKGGGSLI